MSAFVNENNTRWVYYLRGLMCLRLCLRTGAPDPAPGAAHTGKAGEESILPVSPCALRPL